MWVEINHLYKGSELIKVEFTSNELHGHQMTKEIIQIRQWTKLVLNVNSMLQLSILQASAECQVVEDETHWNENWLIIDCVCTCT